MTGWQIIGNEQLEKVTKTEPFDGLDSIKVKITRTLLTIEDIAAFCGEDKEVAFPVIPGRSSVGQISETGGNSVFGLEKGTRVYLAPISSCGKCYHCSLGKPEECYNFVIAGKNTDGFLRDFAVMKTSDIFALPSSVKDEDAIYIEYISLALSVIDKLKIEKGQHVAVIGCNVLASILAQLIIYYQGVPILIDSDENDLLLAKKSGIYYTVGLSDKTEEEISTITGGRMASRVVYLTRSGLPTDLAFKLAAPCANVGFAGFSYSNIKVPFSIAMRKQINAICITNGFGNTETAINLLANKAVDLSNYRLPLTAMDDIEKTFISSAEDYKEGKKIKNIFINMVD